MVSGLKVFSNEVVAEVVLKEIAANEIPKVPSDVRAARNREVKQTPQRKPTTHIWH
jgi:hypothetical protein